MFVAQGNLKGVEAVANREALHIDEIEVQFLERPHRGAVEVVFFEVAHRVALPQDDGNLHRGAPGAGLELLELQRPRVEREVGLDVGHLLLGQIECVVAEEGLHPTLRLRNQAEECQ